MEPTFSRFAVRRRLGAGGMGVVYEAEDTQRKSVVALKTLAHADPVALHVRAEPPEVVPKPYVPPQPSEHAADATQTVTQATAETLLEPAAPSRIAQPARDFQRRAKGASRAAGA